MGVNCLIIPIGDYLIQQGGDYMFIIYGGYQVVNFNGVLQGDIEEIDSFTTESEAQKMLMEYKLAYGKDWSLWVLGNNP